MSTVGSYGETVSCERGTPVPLSSQERGSGEASRRSALISHKVLPRQSDGGGNPLQNRACARFPLLKTVSRFRDMVINLFCKSQFSHKSANLFFISVVIMVKSTDLCGN